MRLHSSRIRFSKGNVLNIGPGKTLFGYLSGTYPYLQLDYSPDCLDCHLGLRWSLTHQFVDCFPFVKLVRNLCCLHLYRCRRYLLTFDAHLIFPLTVLLGELFVLHLQHYSRALHWDGHQRWRQDGSFKHIEIRIFKVCTGQERDKHNTTSLQCHFQSLTWILQEDLSISLHDGTEVVRRCVCTAILSWAIRSRYTWVLFSWGPLYSTDLNWQNSWPNKYMVSNCENQIIKFVEDKLCLYVQVCTLYTFAVAVSCTIVASNSRLAFNKEWTQCLMKAGGLLHR